VLDLINVSLVNLNTVVMRAVPAAVALR